MRGRFGADPTVARKTATETAKRMKRNAGTKTLHDHTADIGDRKRKPNGRFAVGRGRRRARRARRATDRARTGRQAATGARAPRVL